MTLPKGSFQQWMEILLGWEHSAANEYTSTITCCPQLFCSCMRAAVWQKANEPLAESGRCEQRNCRDFSWRRIPRDSRVKCLRKHSSRKEQCSRQTERRKEKRGRLKKKRKRNGIVWRVSAGKDVTRQQVNVFSFLWPSERSCFTSHLCFYNLSVRTRKIIRGGK